MKSNEAQASVPRYVVQMLQWLVLITVHHDFYCSIVRLFSSDRKRVENALENCRLPYSRVNTPNVLILIFLGVHNFAALEFAKQKGLSCKTHSESFTFILLLFSMRCYRMLPPPSRMTHSAPRGEKKLRYVGHQVWKQLVKRQKCRLSAHTRSHNDYSCERGRIMQES